MVSKGGSCPGTFLVRRTTKNPGCLYVLSHLCAGHKVMHALIKLLPDNRLTIDNMKTFPNIKSLVGYYRKTPLVDHYLVMIVNNADYGIYDGNIPIENEPVYGNVPTKKPQVTVAAATPQETVYDNGSHNPVYGTKKPPVTIAAFAQVDAVYGSGSFNQV